MMLELQALGCHNINFVTPEHVAPQIAEAVPIAIRHGLRLPIVYNTSAYDALDSIELMDRIVDIYMPDFKYWSRERSRTYMKAEDYPDAARAAIAAMHAQVGPLTFDDDGLARRGVLDQAPRDAGVSGRDARHSRVDCDHAGPDTYVNLMDQYYPAGKVSATSYAEINRRLTSGEFREAHRIAADLGLRRIDERRPHARLLRRMM
jgi:putative pyruvate formate lyase activating enzyme